MKTDKITLWKSFKTKIELNALAIIRTNNEKK